MPIGASSHCLGSQLGSYAPVAPSYVTLNRLHDVGLQLPNALFASIQRTLGPDLSPELSPEHAASLTSRPTPD